MEKQVLIGLCDEFITEASSDKSEFPRTGWANTAFTSAVSYTGLTQNAVKGYVTQLIKKGFLTVEKHYGDLYITLKEPCSEIVEYADNYVWRIK